MSCVPFAAINACKRAMAGQRSRLLDCQTPLSVKSMPFSRCMRLARRATQPFVLWCIFYVSLSNDLLCSLAMNRADTDLSDSSIISGSGYGVLSWS
jgi:hypothetical protein